MRLPSLRRGAVVAAFAATCALGVASAPAQTAPRGVSLEWRAPAECPEAPFVNAEIARLLVGSSADAARIDARADVTRAGAAWRVRLVTGGGERTLEADSCRALAEATALILAMAVDPARVAANRAVASGSAAGVARVGSDAAGAGDAGAGPDGALATSTADAAIADSGAPDAARADAKPDATPDASAPEVPAAKRPAPSSPSPSAPRSASRTASYAIGAGALGDLGTLPFAGVGASLFAAWTPSPLRFEIAGAYFAANHTEPLANGTGGTFGLITGGVRGCYDLVVTDLGVFPCLGLELDALRGEGTGVLTSLPDTSVWVAGTAGLLAQWRLAPILALDLRFEAAFPLQRPEFRIDDVTLHKPAALAGRGLAGAEVRF